jgi:hypothetical protein
MLQQKGVVRNIILKEASIQGTKETLVEAGGGRGPIICYNCNQPGHLAHDCLNPCTMCTYCRALDHATEDCPQLVAKW